MSLARRFHCACATLLVYALRFHGVRIAFQRRSGAALTACRQNRNDVSLICSFALSALPFIYTSRKPARCSIDIQNGILKSVSHLIIILFALSFLKSFYSSIIFFHKDATGRGRSSTRAH